MALLGRYGSLNFYCSADSVLTFTELQREHAGRWARHDVLYKKPVLEFIGPDLASVSLKVRFDATLGFSPIWGLAKLKRMQENRIHKYLIVGGEFMGKYILESVSEERKHFTGKGVCFIAEATLNLVEYSG